MRAAVIISKLSKMVLIDCCLPVWFIHLRLVTTDRCLGILRQHEYFLLECVVCVFSDADNDLLRVYLSSKYFISSILERLESNANSIYDWVLSWNEPVLCNTDVATCCKKQLSAFKSDNFSITQPLKVYI